MPIRQSCEGPSISLKHISHPAGGCDTDRSIISANFATEILEPAHITVAREQFAALRPLSTAASRIKQAIAAIDSTVGRRLVGLLN